MLYNAYKSCTASRSKQSSIKLSPGFTMVEIMIVVVILGVLAAVAVPAFIKYISRSKTSEAYDKLSILYRGSSAYILNSNNDVKQGAGGEAVALKFPPDQGPTPAAGSCCGVPGAQCLSTDADWDLETWNHLNFAISDPHRYWYTYESATLGGSGAYFTARANGDLDCDSVYSTFERCGLFTSDLSIRGGPGVYLRLPVE